jgi:hypothetical protein
MKTFNWSIDGGKFQKLQISCYSLNGESHQFDLAQFHPQPGEHSVFRFGKVRIPIVYRPSENFSETSRLQLFNNLSDFIAAFSIDPHSHALIVDERPHNLDELIYPFLPRRQLEVLLRPLPPPG